MPDLISVPNSGSFENKENTGNLMGHANKKIFKKNKKLMYITAINLSTFY
jgi:hypothetical protein